jgi:phosphoheptose isomerase
MAALQVAKALNVASIGFTGPDNCPMDDLCSVTLHAPRPGTPAIQEAHLPILHALCLALEETRFGT